MPPLEFWWLIEAKIPKDEIPDTVAMKEVRDMVKAAKAQEGRL